MNIHLMAFVLCCSSAGFNLGVFIVTAHWAPLAVSAACSLLAGASARLVQKKLEGEE